jgi:hypothetical protein
MKLKFHLLIFIIFILFYSVGSNAQMYYSTGSQIFYKINVNSTECSCSYDQLSTTLPFYPDGISFLPDTTLVISEAPYIFSIDTLNGGYNSDLHSIYPWPTFFHIFTGSWKWHLLLYESF